MIPGTTHALDLVLDDETLDLSGSDVYVSVQQGTYTLELTGERLDVSGNTVTAYLTQEESMQFRDNLPAQIQVNWTSEALDGTLNRAATDVATVPVGAQLLRRILE